jgi:aldose 1-epimerase
LQIFTPDSRQSIAIENLSGAPDCFNNGMGLVLLAPNSSKTFSVIYQVRINEKANLL